MINQSVVMWLTLGGFFVSSYILYLLVKDIKISKPKKINQNDTIRKNGTVRFR